MDRREEIRELRRGETVKKEREEELGKWSLVGWNLEMENGLS